MAEQLSLVFPYNARTTYTAVKQVLQKRAGFSAVRCRDELFEVEARRGAWLNPFSESVKLRVVATSAETCRVVVESASRSWFNLLNFGANRANVRLLSDDIHNEVFKLMPPRAIPMRETSAIAQPRSSTAEIRLTPPDIKFR